MSDCDEEGCVDEPQKESAKGTEDEVERLSLDAEDFDTEDFDSENLDVSKWEIVFAFGQKFLARVRLDTGPMGVMVPILVLWPVLDYASKTSIAKDGRLDVKRQAAPFELMASLPKMTVPVVLAGRSPISSYEPEDQETFREMIVGALVNLRKDIRESRGRQPGGQPRVALASAVPQHLAGRTPPTTGRRR